jgi:hypothetical protein
VPVAEVSALESTRGARERYERDKIKQRQHLKTQETVETTS